MNRTPRYSVICPPCGLRIDAETEDELIRAVQEHARTEHGHDVSPEDVRAGMLPPEGQ